MISERSERSPRKANLEAKQQTHVQARKEAQATAVSKIRSKKRGEASQWHELSQVSLNISHPPSGQKRVANCSLSDCLSYLWTPKVGRSLPT